MHTMNVQVCISMDLELHAPSEVLVTLICSAMHKTSEVQECESKGSLVTFLDATSLSFCLNEHESR